MCSKPVFNERVVAFEIFNEDPSYHLSSFLFIWTLQDDQFILKERERERGRTFASFR